MNLTVPLASALGESGTPGEAAGFGLLDAATARDLIAAAVRDPRSRWCVTALAPPTGPPPPTAAPPASTPHH